MSTYNVEYTDTFGGQANYCWVRRATVRLPDDASPRALMKAAKDAVSISGLDGRWGRTGDGYEFRPYHCATILFVNWTEDEFAYDREDSE